MRETRSTIITAALAAALLQIVMHAYPVAPAKTLASSLAGTAAIRV
ncbi:hypothetical protein BH09PSE4_BH09PSE4_22800 [soil metagenome]